MGRSELRWSLALEGAVRTFGVVTGSVLLAENTGFEKMAEGLVAAQQALAERSRNALHVAVLPRGSGSMNRVPMLRDVEIG